MLLSEISFNHPFYVVGNKADRLVALSRMDNRVQCQNTADGSTAYLPANTAIKPALEG